MAKTFCGLVPCNKRVSFTRGSMPKACPVFVSVVTVFGMPEEHPEPFNMFAWPWTWIFSALYLDSRMGAEIFQMHTGTKLLYVPPIRTSRPMPRWPGSLGVNMSSNAFQCMLDRETSSTAQPLNARSASCSFFVWLPTPATRASKRAMSTNSLACSEPVALMSCFCNSCNSNTSAASEKALKVLTLAVLADGTYSSPERMGK
mmetsp:Transcript_79587/g.170662  ORF Transcript_79587/g.170662 Transcript_79587/m.170662 type:complete len:202 (+) Transcript_79587:519-1124(+)